MGCAVLVGSPTATDDYLYDGAGQRIQKLSASGGTSTLTSYLAGGIEEAQSVNGGAVTLTKYLGAPGMPQAIRVGVSGTLSYLASDGLSSVSEALDSSSGNVTAQQLYAPYGGTRYTNGSMPTSKGFTGQRADSASSGLDYYGARSYDPVLGQFASADTVADGLNRYGYVHGNPTTFSDPSGHRAGGCIINDGAYYCPPVTPESPSQSTPPGPPHPTPPGDGGGGNGTCTSTCGGNPPGCTGCKATHGHPEYDKYGCAKDDGERVCDAQQVAGDATKELVDLGVFLAGLALLFTGFAITAGPIFAPLLIMLASLVGSMSLLAGKLASEFTSKAGASPGRLDKAAFRSFAHDVGVDIVGFLALTQLAAGIFIAVPGLSSMFGAGLKIGGILGSAIIGGMAEQSLLEMSTVLFGGQGDVADAPSAHHSS